MNRGGFTLAEIIVGVVLTSVVMTGVMRTVISTQRNSQALAQRIDVQQNVRSAVQYLGASLRELDADDGDLVTIGNNLLQFRTMRWVGFMCGPPVQVGADVLLPVRNSRFYGILRPDASLDSLLVFRDGATSTRMDDRWTPGGLQSIANGTCTDGSAASVLRLGVSGAEGGADSVLAGVTEGAPVRGFQVAELSSAVSSYGRSWVARRTASQNGSWSDYEYVVGPITAGGFTLSYFDDSDNPTTAASDVASLSISIRGQSLERVQMRSDGYINDSLLTRVTLRNNRRF